MKSKPYPEYKDSGVEWIGKIPENWNTGLLKRFSDNITDGSHFSPETVEDGKHYITVRDLTEKDIDFENAKKVSETDFASLKRNGCQPKVGDVILSKDGTIGKCIVVRTNDFVALSSLGLITPKNNLNPHYLRYYLISDDNVSQMYSFIRGSALKRLTINLINNLRIIVPPYEHQMKIVNFLDKKTSEIDLTIEKDTLLIELLKEKRTALINHVVTKGLDPTVKMKDSGVEWIGEIPEDWNARKLKLFVSKIGSGITPRGGASVYVEEGIALLRSQNVHFDGLRLKDVSYITEEINKTMLNSVVKNKDVLLNITGASIGRCTYFENHVDKANVNQHVCIIRPEKIFHRFLNYVLMSNIGQDQIFSTQMGSSREGVNFEQIGNFIITCPPYEQQKDIANYLDKSTKKIDLTIKKIQENISLLEEYKNSLIHHLVTGKVDVREVAV